MCKYVLIPQIISSFKMLYSLIQYISIYKYKQQRGVNEKGIRVCVII